MNTSNSSHRILLVEDESILRQLNTLTLAGAGYQVDAFEDGQSGWEALQAGDYGLLITDNQMAGLTGSELIRKLRSARMTLPVIFASGGDVPEEVPVGSSLQPLTALPKPFSPAQLLATVVEVLRLARRDPADSWASLDVSGDSCLHWGLNE